MLCSRCSEIIRPIVAMDIDGTMGDYHGHFLDFAAHYLNRTAIGNPYRGQGDFKDWFAFAFQTDIATFRQIKLAYRQGGMKRSMPPWGSMPEATRIIRSWGCEVWITTTRPYLRLDGVDPDTREWLARNHVHYDGLLYDEDKYHRLAENVDSQRVIAVVDDLFEQYDEAATIFGPEVPVLRKTEYNRLVRRSNEVSGADELLGEIHLRLTQWKKLTEHH